MCSGFPYPICISTMLELRRLTQLYLMKTIIVCKQCSAIHNGILIGNLVDADIGQ